MKPGYYQFRLTPENRAHLDAICQQLGLDSKDWGAKSKAVNFALRVTATGLVKAQAEDEWYGFAFDGSEWRSYRERREG